MAKLVLKNETIVQHVVLRVFRLLIALAIITFRYENCLKLVRLVKLNFKNKMVVLQGVTVYLTEFDVINIVVPPPQLVL